MRFFSLLASVIFFSLAAFAPVPAARAQAPVQTAARDEKLDHILRQLDEAAKRFHNTSADFEYDTVQTDPVPDKDVQKGSVYYEREGKTLEMAAHINERNGHAINNIYTYTNSVLRLYSGADNKVTTYNKVSQFESYLMLGFGASGHDLEDKWEIRYIGPEVLVDNGVKVKTENLELVAKDPAVRKTIPKVQIWIDTERGVSLKQVFQETGGEYRVSVYFNFKLNQPLPKSAFTLPAEGNNKTAK
jgi:outer membrane lipoprotein-sorting protein